MTEITVNNKKILMYDNIRDMPIRRYQQSNKYLMIDSSIGSDFSDFDRRTIRITEFLKKGMIDEAIKEIENRRQMVWNAYKQYTPKGYAFALLVFSIDGQKRLDISDEGLDKTLDFLEKIGISYQKIIDVMADVKKKLKPN